MSWVRSHTNSRKHIVLAYTKQRPTSVIDSSPTSSSYFSTMSVKTLWILGFLALGTIHMTYCQVASEMDRDMGCFEHRYYHNKKTYVLFFLTMNYKDATQVCKATGGQIVIIRDAETSDFISKLRTDTRLYGYWIDIKDWVKQEQTELSPFSGWSRGLPKRGKSSAGKDRCPYLSVALNLDWDDGNCKTTSLPYICQYQRSSQLENLPCLNDTCFELVYSASNWDDAKSDCNKRGGSLTLIEQKETHDFLKSFLFQNRKNWVMNITNNKKPGATFEKLPAVDTWIGVHLAARQWTYLDGSPVLYAKWADGEPNNWRGLNEECAVFSREWNDIECDNKRKYICGFPESVRSTSNCGDGMCYELYDDLMDFENAEQDCKKRGGSLAEIKSEATNTLLKDMTQKNGKLNVWIGSRSSARDFQYNDGTPLTFTKWGEDEPNNWRNSGEDCTVIGKQNLWNDVPCSEKYNFICEYQAIENMDSLLSSTAAVPSPRPTPGITPFSPSPTTKLLISTAQATAQTKSEFKDILNKTSTNFGTLVSKVAEVLSTTSPQKESYVSESCKVDHEHELCLGKGQLAGILIGCTILNILWLTAVVAFFWLRFRGRPTNNLNKFSTLEEDPTLEMLRSE